MDDEVAKAKAHKKTNALFVLACARGYIGDVHALVEQGADKHARDKRGVSALHYASGQGRLEAVRFLWSKGVELDSEDPGGNQPLHYAVMAGKAEVVKFLLSKAAWVEGSNEVDDTVLHIAARKGQAGILEDLLEHGGKAVIKDVNKRGLTALGEAIVNGKTEAAKALIEAGATLKEKPHGWSLLHLAVALNQAASSKFLLDTWDNVNDAGNSEGLNALHCAAVAGSEPLAKLLIKAGADLALANFAGQQAKDLAPAGNKDLRKLLHTTAPPKIPMNSQKRVTPGLKSDLDLFKELSDAEKIAKIERWASLDDASKLEKQLLEFPGELRKQLVELKRLYQARNIQQGIVELLEDDDFQKLATDPKAIAVVEEVHGDRKAFEKYADNNLIMSLLSKLGRFQAVVRANGSHQVPYQSLLRSSEQGYQEKSVMRLKGMEMMIARRKQAALAAALSEGEEEALEKAKWWLDPKNDPARRPGSHTNATAVQDTAQASGAASYTSTRSGSAGQGKKPEFLPPPSRPAADVTELPPPEPFTWRRFGRELRNSLVRSIIIFVLFIVVVYGMTGKPPWQLVDYVADASLRQQRIREAEL